MLGDFSIRVSTDHVAAEVDLGRCRSAQNTCFSVTVLIIPCFYDQITKLMVLNSLNLRLKILLEW